MKTNDTGRDMHDTHDTRAGAASIDPERDQRSTRDQRDERSERDRRSERDECDECNESDQRSARSENAERNGRSARNECGEPSACGQRAERSGRSEHDGRSELRGRDESAERDARGEHDERGERNAHSARNERDGHGERNGHAERSERSVRSEHDGRNEFRERSKSAERDARGEHDGRSKRDENADRNARNERDRHAHLDHHARPTPARADARARPGPRAWLLIAALAALGIVGLGAFARARNLRELGQIANEDAQPAVQLITPQPGPVTRTLTLPGNVRAWYAAPIYAQVSGYVRHWYKDYGAPVKAGETLATIDAPAVDEQYQSAQADLDVARTNYRLAQLTAQRWLALAGTQAVSQQDVDVKAADAQAQQARVRAAEHEVARYRVLEGFKNIVAPFAGVVTSRSTDVGNYVNAAGGDVGSSDTANELFSVADVHEMRVFVSVPQDDAGILKPGLTATLTLPQFPGKTFGARFDTSAGAFNAQTRTVVAELLVPNPEGLLWPGAYANVTFDVPLDPGVLVVPEQALVFRADGEQVAVVDARDRVHLRAVKLGLNFGKTVQVLAGVNANERIVLSPSAGLLDGERVRVVQPVSSVQPASPGAAPAGQGGVIRSDDGHSENGAAS